MCDEPQAGAERADAYYAVTFSPHCRRRFSRRAVPCLSCRFRAEGRGVENDRADVFSAGRTSPAAGGTEGSVQPEARRRHPRSIERPWRGTALSIRNAASASGRRRRGVGLQPSLFTRLADVEAELHAMKDLLAELKVNQDELRHDRDEWRWRAERLLADRERGAWQRWHGRAAAALDAATTSLCGLIAEAQKKLAETKANRGALRQDHGWRGRAKRFLSIGASRAPDPSR